MMVVGFAEDVRGAALHRVLDQPGELIAVSGLSSL